MTGLSDKKQKILYLITQSEWGGAQRYIYDLATNLKNDFDVVVAFGEKKELFDRLEKEKIRTIPLSYLKREISFIDDFLAFKELLKIISQEKPDIIHLNSSKAGILGSLTAKLLGVKKIIYTAHGWVFNEPLPWRLKSFYFWAEKISASWKDKIICVSEYDRRIAIEKNFCHPEKLIFIHNGIDLNKINFLSREEAKNHLLSNIYQPSNNTKIIGTIANLYKTKGVEYLIEAAKIINNSDFIFIVIGEGDERKKLEKLIKNYGLEKNFFLVGNIPDAHKYFKAVDLFVLPSVKEGFPYTILEAMAAQVPIIATKVGGIPEMIENNKTGILVKAKDSQGLAEKIIAFFKNKIPDQNYSLKAYEKLRGKFALEKMIKETEEAYQI